MFKSFALRQFQALRAQRKLGAFVIITLLASLLLGTSVGDNLPVVQAATIAQGAGSYTDTLPAGKATPQATIYKTANVTGKVPTNDWWSSLVFKVYPDHHSEVMYPHPLAVLAKANGLAISYPTNYQIVGAFSEKYAVPFTEDFTAGVVGLNSAASQVLLDGFSDWVITADWSGGALKATMGHGLPFVYFTKGAGNAQLIFNGTPTVYSNSNGAAHVSINGHTYGIYGPAGSAWTVSGTVLTSNLGGKNYFSVATLPDTSAATFNDYKNHAFAFVTNTNTTWSYDQATATVNSTYSLSTSVKEGTENRALTALYRHQWLNSSSVNTGYSYTSTRGQMKVVRGNSFSTSMKYQGVLPALPDKGTYNRTQLYNYVNDIYAQTGDTRFGLSAGADTYWTGKALGRIAQLVPIAAQMGHTAARDSFLTDLKARLQDWFTASSGETTNLFYYDNNWGTLIGYNAGYGSDTELNDHHFHYGYYIMAAAIVAMYDPNWATDSQWGSMVKLLIKDAANWDVAADSRFPRLRNFDTYAGHGWASGDVPFASGNNQESSSESINFSTGLILWGSATGNNTIRDLGIYLYTTEVAAIEQYWFDVDDAVFPSNFNFPVVGMVWGDGGVYGTWWTSNPEEIHGINFLPLTGGSLYLGRRPSYVTTNYNYMVQKNGGAEVEWKDIIWSFQAFADPQATVNKFGSGNYTPEAGETKAHTYHWLHNLNALGQVDTSITANVPTYAVFNKNGVRTCVAYNAAGTTQTVTFSNGSSISVPARSTATSNCSGNVTPTPTPTTGGPTPTPTTTGPTPTATATPTATSTPTPTPSTSVNPYNRVEAENYTSQSGVVKEATGDTGGGQNIAYLANGDYIAFTNVNFGTGGAVRIDSRVASGATGGVSGLIEYWIDGIGTGTKLGDFSVGNTGGWQVWQTIPANTLSVTGTHTLYVRFVSGQPADFVNMNWFQFIRVN